VFVVPFLRRDNEPRVELKEQIVSTNKREAKIAERGYGITDLRSIELKFANYFHCIDI